MHTCWRGVLEIFPPPFGPWFLDPNQTLKKTPGPGNFWHFQGKRPLKRPLPPSWTFLGVLFTPLLRKLFQTYVRYQKILRGWSFGCKNLFNFSHTTMKFHHHHHASVHCRKFKFKNISFFNFLTLTLLCHRFDSYQNIFYELFYSVLYSMK